jgi:hypothetical protein
VVPASMAITIDMARHPRQVASVTAGSDRDARGDDRCASVC